MTHVIIREDCGNSPKNRFVQDLTIAFARRNIPYILDSVSDDICWIRPGEKTLQGKAELAAVLEKLDRVAEITVYHAFTHGKTGAVNGVMQLENGQSIAFCDVYVFSNAKGNSVSEVTTYQVTTDR